MCQVGVDMKQKPLTPAELSKLESQCQIWIERKDGYLWPKTYICLETYGTVEIAKLIDGYEFMKAYGIAWRCWRDRPTDEERLTIPWKDGIKWEVLLNEIIQRGTHDANSFETEAET